jgi:hypothetical protein
MSRSNQILQGLEEALAHAKGDKVLKTVIDSQSKKEFDEDSDNPDTIEGKKKGKAMDITDLEQAWASQRVKASESPEEIVEEAMDMAKANILSLKRHIDALLPMLDGENTCFAESWVQGKLTLADDYIKAVHDYALSEQNEDSSKEPEESDSNKLYTREELMKMKRNQ